MSVIEITSATDLAKIGVEPSHPLDGLYMQTADIALTGAWTPIGETAAQPFTGVYNGGGHRITGLSYDKTGEANYAPPAGLFMTLRNAAVLDLGVAGSVLKNKGDASSNDVGMLAGLSIGSGIYRVAVSGAVKGTNRVGGLIGNISHNTVIEDSYSTATVDGVVSGGLVGATSNTTAQGGGNDMCYLTRIYTAGAVTYDEIMGSGGGIIGEVGFQAPITLTQCYWDTQATGLANSGWAQGSIGHTTFRMRQQSTFSGWDFDGPWRIRSGFTRPFLAWQSVPVTAGDAVIDVLPGAPYGWLPRPELQYHTFMDWLLAGTPVRAHTTVTEATAHTLTADFRLGEYPILRWQVDPSYAPAPPVMDETWVAVSDVWELQAINTNNTTRAGKYYQTGHIDASITAQWNAAYFASNPPTPPGWISGEGFQPIGTIGAPFTGKFNGQGYKITGLFQDRAALRQALFGEINSGAELYGISRVGGSTFGSTWVAGIVAFSSSGNDIITYCSNSATVTGQEAAGIVSRLDSGNNTVAACLNTGTLTSTGICSGGVVGRIESGQADIINCANIGNTVSAADNNGGILGNIRLNIVCNITNCYSAGSITTAGIRNGGIVGWDLSPTGTAYTNCYSATDMSGVTNTSTRGGFVGSGAGTAVNCFYDLQRFGHSPSDAAGVPGLPTTEMFLQSTYTGWDFENVWWDRRFTVAIQPGGTTTPTSVLRQVNETYPVLPSPTLPGVRLLGWRSPAGWVNSGDTILTPYAHAVAAQWERIPDRNRHHGIIPGEHNGRVRTGLPPVRTLYEQNDGTVINCFPPQAYLNGIRTLPPWIEGDPYIEIHTVAEFQSIGTVLPDDANYRLMCNLDAGDVVWTPLPPFSGTFWGAGHWLVGVHIEGGPSLFSTITATGLVQDLFVTGTADA